ncbi:MAG TPA: glycerophosphodiester phosphodiesterase family protein, partial [Bacteroidota bacterium]
MKGRFARCLILVLATANSCVFDDPLNVVRLPGPSSRIGQMDSLNEAQKSRLEGIYLVEAGSQYFGSTVVVKWNSRKHLTIFTGESVSYLVLEAGHLDSIFFLEGYWRSQNSLRSGLAQFEILKDGGGKRLMGDTLAMGQLIIEGEIGEENNRPSIPVVLRFLWAIRSEILARNFWILAHRGGGIMSGHLPHSENTVELIRLAEQFGANGVEIDVRLTKDNFPVLYHDNTLNPRLVRKTPMLGGVEDYTLAQLRTFVRLINGEQIPTLDEALRVIVYETDLRFVWLDSKTEGKDLMKQMVPLMQQYMAEAGVLVGLGLRDSLEIMMGVPTDKIYEEVLKYPGFAAVPTIAEKSLEKARTMNARVWAPLWSNGINNADNAIARSEGRRIFVW